jgi:hypothetical protein
MGQRHRAKISAVVDRDVLKSVDAYLQDHPDRDRDTVINEALRIWLDLALEQDRAMEEQYAATDDIPEEERRHWDAVLKANARVMLSRDPDA